MIEQLGHLTLATKFSGQTARLTFTWQSKIANHSARWAKTKAVQMSAVKHCVMAFASSSSASRKTFILEQVPNIECKTHKGFLNKIIKKLRSITCLPRKGHKPKRLYKLHQRTLNSQDDGSPQIRKKIYVVGMRDDIANTFRQFKMPA